MVLKILCNIILILLGHIRYRRISKISIAIAVLVSIILCIHIFVSDKIVITLRAPLLHCNWRQMCCFTFMTLQSSFFAHRDHPLFLMCGQNMSALQKAGCPVLLHALCCSTEGFSPLWASLHCELTVCRLLSRIMGLTVPSLFLWPLQNDILWFLRTDVAKQMRWYLRYLGEREVSNPLIIILPGIVHKKKWICDTRFRWILQWSVNGSARV